MQITSIMIEQCNLESSTDRPKTLIVTNKLDPHADIIIRSLRQKGLAFVRFNTEDFPLKSKMTLSLENSDIETTLKFPNCAEVRKDDICAVWYRRPAPFEFPEEFDEDDRYIAERETNAAIRGLWQLLDCTWINHPELNRIAEIKLHQLKKAMQLKFEIPKTLVTNDSEEAYGFIKSAPDDVVVKTLAGGALPQPDDPRAIFTNIIKADDLNYLDQVGYTPTLFQYYCPKYLEIRTTVVGKQAFSAEIYSQESPAAIHDWRRDVLNLQHRIHQLPENVAEKCIRLVKGFGLNFGAIDLILTPDDRYIFLELNPNGQWAWIEELTGLPISEALIDLMFGRETIKGMQLPL